jgi:hypothetical protein
MVKIVFLLVLAVFGTLFCAAKKPEHHHALHPAPAAPAPEQPAPAVPAPPQPTPAVPALAQPAAAEEGPWLTGPLLTPSGVIIPLNYINVEPYLFVNVTTGRYNKHWHAQKIPRFYNINVQLPIEIGLSKWLDIIINPQASYNRTKNASCYVLNDTIATLNFQLYHNHTDLKFYIQETFPTGRYQKLRPKKLSTDIGGMGAYSTGVGLVVMQTIHFCLDHYLVWRLNPFYTYLPPVHVKGASFYGGVKTTHGRIDPQCNWGALFGLEYTLTKHWAFAFDAYGFCKTKAHFSGRSGFNPDGTPASVGLPSAVQFSLAPAIEYNFSSSIGLIAGTWFTIGGRNSFRFISAVIAFNYFGPISSSVRKPVPDVESGGLGGGGLGGGGR